MLMKTCHSSVQQIESKLTQRLSPSRKSSILSLFVDEWLWRQNLFRTLCWDLTTKIALGHCLPRELCGSVTKEINLLSRKSAVHTLLLPSFSKKNFHFCLRMWVGVTSADAWGHRPLALPQAPLATQLFPLLFQKGFQGPWPHLHL